MPITADSLVNEVMHEWPATMRVFLDYRMKCVGCPIGVWHTVNDSCREHGVDLDEFLAALHCAARLSNCPEMRPSAALTSRSA